MLRENTDAKKSVRREPVLRGGVTSNMSIYSAITAVLRNPQIYQQIFLI